MTTPERKASSARDMRGVGMAIGEVNTRNLAERRRKKGDCLTCGNKTHKIGLFGKRTALTVEGSCLYGRCLLCHPLEGYMQRPAPGEANQAPKRDPYMDVKQKFPHSFVIETERPDDIPDDGTLVSGITMDHRLLVGARNWNGDVLDHEIYDDDSLNQSGDPAYNKPTPSIGGDDMKPPGRRRHVSNDSFSGGRPFGPPKRYTSQREAMMDQVGVGMDMIQKDLLQQDMIQQGPTQHSQRQLLRNDSRKHRSISRYQPDENEVYYSTNTSARNISHQKDSNPPTVSTSRRNSTEPSRYSNASADEIHFQPPGFQPPRYTQNGNEEYHHGENLRPVERKSDTDRVWESTQNAPQQHYPSQANGGEEYRHGDVNYRPGERKLDTGRGWDPNQNASSHQYPSHPQKHLSHTNSAMSRSSQHLSVSSSFSKRNTDVSNVNLNTNTNTNGSSMKHHTESFEYSHQSGRSYERDTQEAEQCQQFQKDPYNNVGRAESERHISSPQNRYKIDSSVGNSEGKRPPLVSRRGMPDDDCTEGFTRVGRPTRFIDKSAPDVVRKSEFTPDTIRQKEFAPDVPRKPQEFAPDIVREQQEYIPDVRQEIPPLSVRDIDGVFASLNHSNRGPCFQSLAEFVKGLGKIAKIRIEENNGVQMLVESMWLDMADASIMQSACELLFALTASSDGAPESDMLVGDSAEGAVDALLITMQTHITLESIQRSGCGILHCLASASSNHPQVPDGTLSGAIFMVVNAMAMHRQSQEVQVLGIRALYSQCMLSRHAESNKKNLEQSGRDGGAGMDVIRQAMQIAQADLVTVELAARLYWSLAANEDVARQLMEHPLVANAIIQTIHIYHDQPGTTTLIQAAYGALANLVRVCDDHQIFRDAGLIAKAAHSLETFHNNEALCIEACALLGVLAADKRNFELLATHDVVNTISKVMQSYDHNKSLQEEALSTLLCLVRGSEQNKLCLLSDNTMSSLVEILSDEEASLTIHEMACNLVGSLCVLREGVQIAVRHGVIDAISLLLIFYRNERKIHEASFVTMRNITSEGTGVDLFLRKEISKTILDAMIASTDSVTAQLNACCMLWNICAKAKKDPSAMVSAGATKQVVKAMQTHMESGEVLEMACGALWCFIDQSELRKKELLSCGAIDAVTCSLVMHPKEPKTLEKACGLLANVCTSTQMAEAIADYQGISMIVEAMANNSSSMKLLELGALVLRNLVLTKREFAEEASNGISAVIKCMNDNPDAVAFQCEACNTLWAMAAQSEDCKNKILALDGVTVLMGALEHNACVSDVQDAARGAINQLALS